MAAVYRRMGLRSREENGRRAEGAPPEAAEMLAIGRNVASRLDKTTRTVDHGELLYDDGGLPY